MLYEVITSEYPVPAKAMNDGEQAALMFMHVSLLLFQENSLDAIRSRIIFSILSISYFPPLVFPKIILDILLAVSTIFAVILESYNFV